MWTREAFRRCRFRDQLANPNESKRTKGRAYIYREREEEEGHFLRLRYREAKEEGERNGGNRVKSFLLIYRAVAFPGCCSYDDTKICRHTTKGREGAKIERIRFAFWLLCPRRRGVGRESETVGREIRV